MIPGNHRIGIGIACVLICILTACSVSRTQKPALIDEAVFGMVRPGDDGQWQFTETDRIPNTPGTGYIWHIHLLTDKRPITWREEFTLPAPAPEWGGNQGGKIRVSPDRTMATTEKTESPMDGWISNGWAVAEGDPSGRYEMKIFVDGEFVKKFVFFVE